MSARGSGRVSFKPDTDEKTKSTTTTTSRNHNSTNKASSGGDKTRFATSCRFRVPGRSELSSPVKFLKRLGDKVAAALQFVTGRGRRRRRRRSSPNVSSSSGRSNPSIAPLDSHHRAEAISDCIEFINSSSSLQRSNSVPTNPC